MSRVDAIVLVGGLGTRLRDVVKDAPKPMALVNGVPFMDILLDSLNQWGNTGDLVLATGFMADQFEERYGNARRYGFNVLFSREEILLGTGGAIKKALGKTSSDVVIAMNGDTYATVDYSCLMEFHISRMADMTVVLRKQEKAGRYGSVFMDGDGRIISFEEKQNSGSGLINAGIYVFKRTLFDDVRENVKISLETELFPQFLKKRVFGFLSSGKFIDIGTPESYIHSQTYLKK